MKNSSSTNPAETSENGPFWDDIPNLGVARLLEFTERDMIDISRYLSQALEATSPLVKRWMGHDAVRSALEQDFRETIAFRVESETHVAKYASVCPAPGADPADYHLREIDVGDGLSLLAGIHFRNLNVDFPFVGVFAMSRTPEPQEFAALSQRLAAEFRTFRPLSVQWWASENQFDLRTLPGAVGDQRLVAGSLSELLALPAALPDDASLRLEPETAAAGYDRYWKAWNEFLEAQPQWKERLSTTSREQFQECEELGALHVLWIGDRYAGVIAGYPKELKGVCGWEIVEELVTIPNRGRGLARVMQRLFLDRLDPARGTLIFGTIDDRNYPSMKTALRVGRSDVGGWTFIPVE